MLVMFVLFLLKKWFLKNIKNNKIKQETRGTIDISQYVSTFSFFDGQQSSDPGSDKSSETPKKGTLNSQA